MIRSSLALVEDDEILLVLSRQSLVELVACVRWRCELPPSPQTAMLNGEAARFVWQSVRPLLCRCTCT